MSRGASESDHVGVADGDDPVGRIVSELIEHFRSVGRPLRFYEVEETLLGWVGKLRFPMEKLEKEKALLRERLEVMSNEKRGLEFNVQKMRDCLELSGVFLRMGGLGDVNSGVVIGEEIYDAQLRKLMRRGNGEDLTEVVDHLRRKVQELERDSQDSEVFKSNVENLEGEIAEWKRKCESLEVQNVELKKKWDKCSCEVGELKQAVGDMRQRIMVLEMDNERLTEEVGGSSRDAEELKRVKEELSMAKTMLKVKAERSSPDYGALSKKIEELKADNKDADLLSQSLKRDLDESKRICMGLERKNQVVQTNFDELVQENEKQEKKISFWKKNYEELHKRVIVLEKGVDELKSCGDSVLGPGDGRERLTGILSDNGVCSVAGDRTPMSSRVVDLMDSGDDAAAAPVHPMEKRQSPDSLGKEPLPTSRVELKRKSDVFIDLTQNDDDVDEGDGLCRSSSRARNK